MRWRRRQKLSAETDQVHNANSTLAFIHYDGRFVALHDDTDGAVRDHLVGLTEKGQLLFYRSPNTMNGTPPPGYYRFDPATDDVRALDLDGPPLGDVDGATFAAGRLLYVRSTDEGPRLIAEPIEGGSAQTLEGLKGVTTPWRWWVRATPDGAAMIVSLQSLSARVLPPPQDNATLVLDSEGRLLHALSYGSRTAIDQTASLVVHDPGYSMPGGDLPHPTMVVDLRAGTAPVPLTVKELSFSLIYRTR